MKPSDAEWFVRRSRATLGARLGGSRLSRAASVVVVPVALAPWLYNQLRKELQSPLFRDSAQSQYSGWCLRHGVKLYRDVGAPDGPFIHFLHAIMQMFAGISDRGCRRADLVVQLVCSGTMGAVLAPRFADTLAAAVLQRMAWALLAASLWMSWYVSEGWGMTVQRDAYYALFGYLGLVLIHASAGFSIGRARIAAFAGGALSVLLVFTRHSGIAFPACAALGLLLADDPVGEKRAPRLRAALQGGATAIVVVMGALAVFGSLPGLWFWYMRFPFTAYRWLGKQNAFRLLTEFFADASFVAVVALVGTVVAVAVRLVPRRSLAFAFPPMLFLIAACLAGKGWANHFQQVLAGAIPLELVLLSHIWDYRAEGLRWRPEHAFLAVAALLFVANRANEALHQSPYYALATPQPIDRDIADAHAVGAYVKAHTSPDETVFLYGHESHVLLDAERRPAVPYYVNMLLNIEGFYRSSPAAAGEGPNERQRAEMLRLQEEIATDACGRLASHPPGAMVFLDESLGRFHDAVAEVSALCPRVRPMLEQHYTLMSVPDVPGYHVYLKSDAGQHAGARRKDG